jgi:hypothetical protein
VQAGEESENSQTGEEVQSREGGPVVRKSSGVVSVLATLGVTTGRFLFESEAAFASGPEAPEAAQPEPLFAATATLKGIVNPRIVVSGEPGEYQFLYKATKVITKAECESGGASKAPASPAGYAGAPAEPVSVSVTGLTPNTEYVVCLAASDAGGGPTVSAPVAFKTATAVAPEPPEASAVSERTPTGATLNGVVDPTASAAVEPGEYQFLYKATKVITKAECESGGASKAPASPAGYAGAPAEPVQAPVSGLTEGTEYVACLATSDAGGRTVSAPVHFTAAIPPEAPTRVNYRSGSATATTAELEGELNPLKAGEAGTYEFLYKASPLSAPPTPECEEAASPQTAALGGKEEHVSAVLTGLQPNARYTFCLRVHNEVGEEATAGAPYIGGTLETFETLPAPPTIEGEAASVTSAGMRLEAAINPNNQETLYAFEYSPSEEAITNSEGTIIKETKAITGFGGQAANITTGTILAPATTYYYRVIAENEQSRNEGTPAKGELESFTTPALPELTLGEAENIAATSAALTATSNSQGVETTYYFQYISKTAYERAATQGDAQEREDPYTAAETTTPITLTSTEPQPIPPAFAGGLLPNTTYYYQAIAYNPFGTITTGQGSFTTTNAPPETPPTTETTGSPPAPENFLTTPAAPPLLAIPPTPFPTSKEPATSTSKTPKLTTTEKLKKALKACKHDHNKTKRLNCERTAKKKYHPTTKPHKT